MAEREIEKAFRERGRGEERRERVTMHGRERNRESLQGWGRGEERRERVTMHGRERNRESLQGWGRGEERRERVAMHSREKNMQRNPSGRGRGVEKWRGEGRKSSNAWQRGK
jgi:hypothetical protein